MSWRVGRKVARTVYENDQIMFLCTTPEDAARVVDELNQSDELRSQLARAYRERDDSIAKVASDKDRAIESRDRSLGELQRTKDAMAAQREDAMVAHRWFAARFGEVMNGRDFSVKCAMASRELMEDVQRLQQTEAVARELLMIVKETSPTAYAIKRAQALLGPEKVAEEERS